MQTKQKLKYKRKLPKANFGLDPNSLSNMNKAGVNPEEESGSTMDAAGKGIGIASSVLEGVSSFMPKDNMDGIGISHKGSSISKGVSGGLKTGASIAKAVPGVGTIVGGVMDAGAAIADMVTGWVDKVREKDPTKVSRLARKGYEDSYSNVGYSFGTPVAKNGMVLNSTPQPKNKLDFDMERSLPSDLAYERDVNKFDYNFVKNNTPKELQEYQIGLPLPNNYRIYKTPKGYYNVYNKKNINIGYNQDGKNYIKGEPQFKNGGKVFAQNTVDIDSTLNANKNLNWVDRLYQKNTPTIFLPGESHPSTHYMESADNFVYPTIIQNEDGKLEYLGNKAYDYAMKTNTAIKFKTPEEAEHFAKNYKKGKNVLKGFKNGGKPQPIYTSDKNDPRLRAYNDSLSLYNMSQYDINNNDFINDWKKREDIKNKTGKDDPNITLKSFIKAFDNSSNKFLLSQKSQIKPIKQIFDDDVNISKGKIEPLLKDVYKKPVQPVIYQEREQPRNIEKLESVGTNKMTIDKPEISLNKKETSSGKYIVNTQNNSYSIPNKALFDIIVKKGRANNSWESNGSGGATFDMSDETFFNYIGEYKKTFELGGDPRHLADIEAEKGEALQRGNKIIPIGGNTHQNGGTPLKVQPDDKYIYSDTLGLDSDGKISIDPKTVSQTFATLAKRTENKYKGKSDDLSLKTKDLELKMLTAKAEEARVLKEQTDEMKMMKKYKAKYGADLTKFSTGGAPFSFNQKNYLDWIKSTPEYLDKDSGLQDLTSDKAKSVFRPMYAENIYNQYGAKGYNAVNSEFMKRDKTQDSSKIRYGVDQDTNVKYSHIDPNGVKNTVITNNISTPSFGKIDDELSNSRKWILGDSIPTLPTDSIDFIESQYKDDVDFYSNLSAAQKAKVPSVSGPAEGDLNRKTQNGLFQNLSQGDKIQLAGMLPAVGYNLAMGLRESEVEQAKKNPYESNILNMMANRKFDMQPYLNEANLANNVAREDIGNNASSVGGKSANLQKLYANNLNALQSLTAKEQEVNNNYRAEEANVKNTLGENARREEIRISDINAQNRATKQNFLGKATQQIGQGINTLGRGGNQSLTNQMQIKAMSELSPDYDIRPLRELYRSGQVDQNGLIEFNGNKYIYDPKRDVATYVGPSSTAPAAPTDGTKSPYSPIPFNLKNFTNSGKTKKVNNGG